MQVRLKGVLEICAEILEEGGCFCGEDGVEKCFGGWGEPDAP